ncbi:Dabb family protein [Guptibacillus hwajinpoensis]|uniref:Stress protein n=1 Tax=Guptibacillus hwajinpoensis TaxID=208199 RepID=A0A0J6CSV0_9BACL|nr:Dabb family protein [Alkalihalobacillus macyae]KMM36155.1 stress protein [Alkalihalobacillus macyae]
MIEHVVLFKFSNETTKEQKEEGMSRLIQVKDKIPGIVDIQAGTNFSDRSQGFESGLTVRFESKEALEAYGPHPAHQDVVAYLKEIGMTEVLALDFECM